MTWRATFWETAILCCLAAAAQAATNAVATVPITFRGAQVMLPASVNGSDRLIFMLDTGFSMTMIRPDLAGALNLRRVGEITVVGIAGEDKASTFEGAIFDIGGARYSTRRLGAMQPTRRRRDGIIGSGLFRQYVVAIDARARTLSLFYPSNFTYCGRGEVVPLKFRRSTPIISASVNIPGREPIPGEFEIDTGCDSAVCLGHEFTSTHRLLPSADTHAGTKYGVGGGARTQSGHLPELQIGKLKIVKPETDFFIEGSPVDRGLAGHIGMEALRQFHVIFDYSRKQMILEPLVPPP